MNILSLFSGWQFKLVLVGALIFGAWAWHTREVSIAVSQAEQRIELQYAREIFKLKDRANEESISLKNKILEQQKEKKRELEIANRNYESLREWLRNLPISGSSNPGNSADAENRAREIIGELRRRDAENLARYGFRTEELKIELLACYKQYDEVKDSLEKFKAKNTSKTD